MRLSDAEFISLATEFGRDLLRTISSIEEEFPKTKEARMKRRMDLRNRFTKAVFDRDHESGDESHQSTEVNK